MITSDWLNPAFAQEVSRRARSNVNLCQHCKACSGGCPFVPAMDVLPSTLIRLVQLGLKDEALRSSTIWACVGCHTRSSQCPQAIDITAVMDVLREMAVAEEITIAEPDIYRFHQEVLGSIRRYGRTHKLEIMMRYKIHKRDWFSDLDVGLKMLAKRKLDLLPSKIEDLKGIRNIFNP